MAPATKLALQRHASLDLTRMAKGSQAPQKAPSPNSPGRRGFRSSYAGLQRAKRSWACEECHTFIEAKPAKKKAPCNTCGATSGWIYFASGIERKRYIVLLERAAAGEISQIVGHPKFKLFASDTERHCDDVAVGTYTADFAYWCNRRKRMVVEDTKPKHFETQISRLKIAIYNANHEHPIEIVRP